MTADEMAATVIDGGADTVSGQALWPLGHDDDEKTAHMTPIRIGATVMAESPLGFL